ncbi:hypothetical protein JL475_06410 [Streptomyces sp. M2CJ-2]|uniref:hypothetical protein n=1 Tax=Streptomyces sp. M2CJ-2 TaxID=2803948 RepID=UPI00192329EF|nr:hypothetical protein [Streptomyces sp. M2CJ-2]MBL3665639.1 hypothetical protein [Streptomyces sp. M2CJ-2]
MKQPKFQFADDGWVAITRDASGQLRTQGVRIFELGDEGVTALLKNADGTHVADPNVIDVIKGDPLEVAKLVALLQLKELNDQATTSAQLDAVAAVANWVTDWEPQRG